jgi:hypothetical protein
MREVFPVVSSAILRSALQPSLARSLAAVQRSVEQGEGRVKFLGEEW